MEPLDIRMLGRPWSADEMHRHHDLPGRLEVVGGKLCLDDTQRALLLGALLEHVGARRAVSLGSLQVWEAAIAERREEVDWDAMPAVGAEQFWRPATQRLSFSERLELKADVGKLRAAPGPRRSTRACTGRIRRNRPKPAISSQIRTFLVAQRSLVRRLEAFAATPAYAQLLNASKVLGAHDAEAWLADWLIQPAVTLGCTPLDLADQPSGIALLSDYLTRVAYGTF